MPALYVGELIDNFAGAMPASDKEQVVPFGSVSELFQEWTRFIRVWADADCHLAIGSDPNANAGKWPLAAKQQQVFSVTKGQRIAVDAFEPYVAPPEARRA